MLRLFFSIFYALLLLSTVMVIIFDDGDSGRKVAWLLIISILPGFGLLLYVLFGINYRHHWFFKRMHQKSIDAFEEGINPEIYRLLFRKTGETMVDSRFSPLARLLNTQPSTTVTNDNDVEIITSGARKFELLMDDLRNAKEDIHMEYFLFGKDEGSKKIRKLLMQKAKEGVRVRFIYENVANFPISPLYYSDMRKAGVEVVKFTNPRNHLINFITKLNYRNHRKIVVIDNKIGYTGGMNIGDRYFHVWRDTHMRLTGNAVAGLQYIFLDSWITAGGSLDHPLKHYFPQSRPHFSDEGKKWEEKDSLGQLEEQEIPVVRNEHDPGIATVQKPFSPELLAQADPAGKQVLLKNRLVQIVPDEPDSKWPLIQMSYEWILSNTKDYIYLQTPYFVPPESILFALKSAALRGVDVRLMVPAKADSFYMGPVNKAYFEECLKAGIKIYEREGEFIHSKTFVADDYLSCIGTANMDFRSFNINYEVNTYIYDHEAALLNKALFVKDMEKCRQVDLEGWSRRGWGRRFVQNILRLFAPLL